MIYIDKVHYAKDNNGNNLYIQNVKCTRDANVNATEECSKQVIIDFLKNNPGCVRTKYRLNYCFYVGEEVHVVDNKYLRTDANHIKSDNLENLPEY